MVIVIVRSIVELDGTTDELDGTTEEPGATTELDGTTDGTYDPELAETGEPEVLSCGGGMPVLMLYE